MKKLYWIPLLLGAVLLSVAPPAFADEPSCRAQVFEHCIEHGGQEHECGLIAHDVCDSKAPGKTKEPGITKETEPNSTSNCTLKYTKGPRHTTRRP
jgi:hypothetical protein